MGEAEQGSIWAMIGRTLIVEMEEFLSVSDVMNNGISLTTVSS